MQVFRNNECNKAIELDAIRSDLAFHREFQRLRRTYSKSNPEINNTNTPNQWDIKNTEFSFNKSDFPMAWDRSEIVFKYLLSLINSKTDIVKVLNIGFGSGNLESLIQKYSNNFQWYGIDFSSASVMNAKINYKWGNFSIRDIKTLKYKKSSFHVAVALEVLEHISPRYILDLLEKINHILVDKGTFIVSVPLNENLYEMLEKGYNPNSHVRIYTPELVKAELNMCGFCVVKEIYLNAFHKLYKLKSLLNKLFKFREPNNVILFCEKM